IGHSLSEQRLLEPQTGKVLTRTLDAYKLPTIADVPEIVAELVDKADAHLTNLGSKGLGEPPIVPTAAAIANAIRDATGADIRSLPITREEVLNALREAEQRQRAEERVGTATAGVGHGRRGGARQRVGGARRRDRARPAAARRAGPRGAPGRSRARRPAGTRRP